MFKKLHPSALFLLLLAGLILSAVFSVAVGAVFISPAVVVRILLSWLPDWAPGQTQADWSPAFEVIILSIRLPHMFLIGLTGAALAGSGAAYQGLFRNPLADPYLIGAASGAGLGAVFAMSLREQGVGVFASLTAASVPAAGFIGALATVGLVYLMAYSRNQGSTVPLILAGVAVSAFATALTSFLMLRSEGQLHRAVAWLLGGAAVGGWEPVWAAAPFIVVGSAVLILCGYPLNVLQFGEEQAAQLGLPVDRVKFIIVVAASLVTAAAVAFSGIIGFIGLTVPHLLRSRVGADYRLLLPLSMLGGAAALLLADILARIVIAPQELPVGIITALVGGPFFIWIMRTAPKE